MMKTKLLNQLCLFVVFGMTSAFMFAQTTFSYTGNMQTYTVPVGMNTLTIEAHGAQGADHGNSSGGLGGFITGKITVTPGEVIEVYVGGIDGYNGGGAASPTAGELAGTIGGGASDVRQGGSTLADRIIVAGGGGGAGRSTCDNNDGGGGGYPGGLGGTSSDETINTGGTGTATAGGDSGEGSCGGDCACSPGGGGGGGADGGGAGGNYGVFGGVNAVGGTGGACGEGGPDFDGPGGVDTAGFGGCFGQGGDAGISDRAGGGGGGGWYGGGAGGGNWGSGGGGGSSYVAPSVTDLMFTNATRVGDGEITITPSLTLGVNDYETTKVSLFPNPTSGDVTISIPIQNAKVFSVTGKKVFEANSNSFDISKLNAGVYLLEIITENGDKVVKRLIKK